MPVVNLPPGCRSLQMEDGTRYVAPRTGGRVTVADDHASAIDRLSGNGDAGLVGRAAFHEYAAVKKAGRWCRRCNRLWYPWRTECCGQATEPE
jgi:hypothetical protein